MPGNHGEITVDDQNGGDNDNEKKKTRKKKKKKDDDGDDGLEEGNQLQTLPIPKPRKRFLSKIRRKPKSPKRSSSPHSCKGGCFSAMRPRRKEEEECSPSSPPSDPNDESFTHGMLRVMLETNDFCSDDCNPHR